MAMDIVAQALMLWPKDGIVIPILTNDPFYFPNIMGLPVTTSVPIGEAILVTTLSLWSIRYQRYVVLPMILASLQSHWSTVDLYTKPYQKVIGLDLSQVPKFFNTQVKRGVDVVTEVAKEVIPQEAKDKK